MATFGCDLFYSHVVSRQLLVSHELIVITIDAFTERSERPHCCSDDAGTSCVPAIVDRQQHNVSQLSNKCSIEQHISDFEILNTVSEFQELLYLAHKAARSRKIS